MIVRFNGTSINTFLTEIPFVFVWKSPNEIFHCCNVVPEFLFFKFSRLKKPTFCLIFLWNPPFYAFCSFKVQNLSMLYAMLRNPSFTSAMLIPIVRGITFPARWCMAPTLDNRCICALFFACRKTGLSKKRMKLKRSMIWYSISSSLRLYSDCRIRILNIITTSNGLRPALLLRSCA